MSSRGIYIVHEMYVEKNQSQIESDDLYPWDDSPTKLQHDSKFRDSIVEKRGSDKGSAAKTVVVMS